MTTSKTASVMGYLEFHRRARKSGDKRSDNEIYKSYRKSLGLKPVAEKPCKTS